MSRSEVSMAYTAAGRQWLRRWKKRGDGSAYSMLNSLNMTAGNTLEAWLKSINLDEHRPKIIEYGYDSMPALDRANEEDVVAMTEDAWMGMKKPHRTLFLKEWKARRRQINGADGGGEANAELLAQIQKKAEIRMLTADEIRALPGGASDFLEHSTSSPAVCYLFKGCPWDNGRGRLGRETLSGRGELHGLVLKEGPVDDDELGMVLKQARGLRVLVFDGTNLSRGAAEHVAHAVAGKSALRLLYMSRTGISHSLVANIARSFTQPTPADLLNGDTWQIGPPSTLPPCLPHPHTHIATDHADPEDMSYFGDQARSSVRSLSHTQGNTSLLRPSCSLSHNLAAWEGRGPATVDLGVSGAGRSRLRTHLILPSCNLNEQSGRWVWELLVGGGVTGDGTCPLAKLDLSGNNLGCEGVERVALALAQPAPAAAGAWSAGRALAMSAALGGYEGLKVLVLRSTGIHCRGAAALGSALSRNGCLQALDLSSNRIADTGARSLADGLLVNHTLTALDLSRNRVGDAGAEALAHTLRNAHSLVVLSLEHCQVSARGVAALEAALAAAPAAFAPLVSAQTVRFAHELALTDPVLQLHLGTKHQRTLDMRRSMLSCEPARRQVMVGLAHARVVENRVGNNSGCLRGQVVMTAILS